MTVILGESYYREQANLLADPIIDAMAQGIKNWPVDDIMWEDGTPRYEFMLAASKEYHARNGTYSESIGGVAEALLVKLEYKKGLSG